MAEVTNTAAETVTSDVASIQVSEMSIRDVRPANMDSSSAVNPQFANPSLSVLPSVHTHPIHTIQSSVRPVATPVPVPLFVPSAVSGSQFLPVPAYQTPGIPPPGVSTISPLMMASTPPAGTGSLPQVPVSSVQNIMAPPYGPGGQPLRFMSHIQNIYAGLPPGAIPPPGVQRYPTMYGSPMVRPVFPPVQVFGAMPPMSRPPLGGIRGPVNPFIVRPPVPLSATPSEKPQTTVYVGKISSTVENDFMSSLLQLCGPVKSWKRPQDPAGTLKGFGFCEFESAEGVLRALRLLNKLNVDGQELMLNVNQTTRVYLNAYVEKKTQGSKNGSESNAEASAAINGVLKSSESEKTSSGEEIKNDSDISSKENSDSADFGLVTEEDREADRESLEKLKGLIEERLKNRPLPPPPPPQTAIHGAIEKVSEVRAASKDRDSNRELAVKGSEDKIADVKNAESKLSDEVNTRKSVSPDRIRHRGKDRDREFKRDLKEREVERYERDREQERVKREKDKEYRNRDDDRRYKLREKEWEAREREKEHWRKKEREREREKAQERKWEIMDQERNTDDAFGKRRRYRISDDERKRRQREKDEDFADRLLEEEEISEAKIREELQEKQSEMLKSASSQPVGDPSTDAVPGNSSFRIIGKSGGATNDVTKGTLLNGVTEDSMASSKAISNAQQNSTAPSRKLGFGISASGKRTVVPSVFHEDEDEDAHTEKKMKPLVPIDYSTEEQQAVHSSVSEDPDHMIAAKRNSATNPKEEKRDLEKEKSRRSRERSNHRDMDRHEEDGYRKDHKSKTSESQKLLDAKQLIDTIPKTKDELFSYRINWTAYDQNMISERLRPWIAKKIKDFLGEEEDTLVDYIVSGTQEHVSANEMLERLQTILDDEAEMFVLKMWRMLIFEIKKVESGLAVKSRS